MALEFQISDLARRLTVPALKGRQDHVRALIAQHLNNMSAGRARMVGAAFEGLRDICFAEARAAVDIAAQNLVRVAKASRGTTATVDDFRSEIREEVDDHVAALDSILADIGPRTLGGGVGIQDSVNRTRHELRNAYTDARGKAAAEIQLALLSASRRPEGDVQGSPAPSLNFYGSVGAVQTGPGAIASVNLGGTERAELARVLEEFGKTAASLPEVSARVRRDVVGLVEDGRNELRREPPDSFKITSVLGGLATTVQTVGALQPAWQVFRAAVKALGIHLS